NATRGRIAGTRGARRRTCSLLARDRDHAIALDREREAAGLERQRLLAEQLAPPAVQGRYVRLIVGGDAVEVVHGGNELGGNAVPSRRHAQQHLEQFARGLSVDRALWTLDPRQRLEVAREPALDRLDDRLAPFRAFEALWQRAQAAEPLDRGRRLHRNNANHVLPGPAAVRA